MYQNIPYKPSGIHPLAPVVAFFFAAPPQAMPWMRGVSEDTEPEENEDDGAMVGIGQCRGLPIGRHSNRYRWSR